MKLTREEVEKVASLARLKFTDEETARLTGELSSILEYIEKLNELDTTDIPPTAYTTDEGTQVREDVVQTSDAQEMILKNAPAREGNLFKVPKVI